MNSLGNAIPVIRVHATHEAGEDDGAGVSGHVLVNHLAVFRLHDWAVPRVQEQLSVRSTLVRRWVPSRSRVN